MRKRIDIYMLFVVLVRARFRIYDIPDQKDKKKFHFNANIRTKSNHHHSPQIEII